MTKLEQAARQALGALVRAEALYGQPNADIQTAIREALAEQDKHEPVAVVEITYGRDPECYVTGNIDNFPEGVFKLYAAPVDAKAIRAEALEEAAKFAYDLRFRCCWTAEAIAAAIRGMK